MSKAFVEQYSSIQQTITQNLSTIKVLLKQAQNLHSIAASLGEDDAAIRDELIAEVEMMGTTIDQLIDQTEKLFKAYKRAYELAFQDA